MKRWLTRTTAVLALLSVTAGLLPPAPAHGGIAPTTGEGSVGAVKKAATGESHSAAVKSDGTLWTWGDNTYGQLGYTYSGVLPRQAEVPGGRTVQDAAVGQVHTAAAAADGTVWTWGANWYGQLGNPEGPAAAGAPVQVKVSESAFLTNITAISTGMYHNLALDADGYVWAWGSNMYGELGRGGQQNGVYAQRVQLATGGFLSDIAEIQAGDGFSMALSRSGQVYTWGRTLYGQLGRTVTNATYDAYAGAVPELTGIQDIYSGPTATSGFAVSSVSHAVYAWGNNVSGQLGLNTGGSAYGTVGTPAVVGTLPAGSRVLEMAVGTYHTAAIVDTGNGSTAFYAAGENGNGEYGINPDDTSISYSFYRNPALDGLTHVWGGGYQTFVQRSDGIAYAFGRNGSHQLGTGTVRADSYDPNKAVMPLSDEGRGTFRGTVKDINTGLPIPGASVTFYWDETYTNNGVTVPVAGDGTFFVKGLIPGQHRVAVQASGYENRDDAFVGGVIDVRSMSERTFYLTPLADPTAQFTDTNYEKGFITGDLLWYSPSSGAQYEVWFVNANGSRVGTRGLGTVTSVSGAQSSLAVDSIVPEGASGIRLFEGTALRPTGGWVAFTDLSAEEAVSTPVRMQDLDSAGGSVQPRLMWLPSADETAVAGYQVLRYQSGGGGETLSPGVASIQPQLGRALTPTQSPTYGYYYPFSQIGYIPKAVGSYDAVLDPAVKLGSGDMLFLIPVDAYGHYSSLYSWHFVYMTDNTSGDQSLPGITVADYLPVPVEPVLYDTDAASGTIGGSILWKAGTGSGYTQGYAVYAVGSAGQRLKKLGQVYYGTRYDFPAGVVLPQGTAGIGIASMDGYGYESAIGSYAPVLQADGSLPVPEAAAFEDADASTGYVSGTVSWNAAADARVSGYELFFLDHWLLPVGRIAVAAAGTTAYGLDAVQVPAGGEYIGITSISTSGRSGASYVPVADAQLQSYLYFTDVDLVQGSIGGSLSWNAGEQDPSAAYGFYFLDGSYRPLGDAVAAELEASGMLELRSGTAVPAGARYIGIAKVNGTGTQVLVHIRLEDLYLTDDADPAVLDAEDLMKLLENGSLSDPHAIKELLNRITPRTPGMKRATG